MYKRRCSLVVEHLLRKQEVAGSIPVVGFVLTPGRARRICMAQVPQIRMATKLRWSSGYDACFTRRRSAVRSRHEVFASANENAKTQKLPGGFEPPSLDSKSRVLTVTPWERLQVQKTCTPRSHAARLENSADCHKGLFRGSNPGPPRPKRGIIPLDQTAVFLMGGWRLQMGLNLVVPVEGETC